MYTVLVNGLNMLGHHGVTAEERASGCQLRVDIVAYVDGKANLTDELGDTLDYGALAELMENVSDKESYKTLERLAQIFSEQSYLQFTNLLGLEIEINKLNPPVPQSVESLGVRLITQRLD